MPKLYIYEGIPSAFATGRNPKNSAIAVSNHLLDVMNKRQITRVLAHELAHIVNRDTLTKTTAMWLWKLIVIIPSIVSGILIFIGRVLGETRSRDEDYSHWAYILLEGLIGLVSALFEFLSLLLTMSLSRNREFAADRTGAEVTGDPLGLASALETLEDSLQTIENNEKSLRHF